jgi:hypothetical protein
MTVEDPVADEILPSQVIFVPAGKRPPQDRGGHDDLEGRSGSVRDRMAG